MRSLSKFRGCLLGGAAGDALGYSVEYLNWEQIVERYGANGILGFDMANDIAIVSDETQMTLFTANALLLAKTRARMRGEDAPLTGYFAVAYLDWLKTQHRVMKEFQHKIYCWLYHVPELRHRRAPCATCMNILESRQLGTLEKPCNQSKGSGGIVRVAPIGLYFDPKKKPQAEIDRLGAEAAAITYGHVMGWLPAAAFVHMISRITYGGIQPADLPELIRETGAAMAEQFGKDAAAPLNNLLGTAIRLANSRLSDRDAIHMLGEGWTAEETLAIACFCVLRHSDSFGPCIIAAANHDGDSDSTASVAGNLFGALQGAEKIPDFFLECLELRNIVEEMAYDLWMDCPMTRNSAFYDIDWARKYIEYRYE